MCLDPSTAKLGWKTNDKGKRAKAHELKTNKQIQKAINTIADVQKSWRRLKETFMLIVDLVSLLYAPAILCLNIP